MPHPRRTGPCNRLPRRPPSCQPSMIPANASSLGRSTGAVRRQPGGTETAIGQATLSREMWKRRAARRWLGPPAVSQPNPPIRVHGDDPPALPATGTDQGHRPSRPRQQAHPATPAANLLTAGPSRSAPVRREAGRWRHWQVGGPRGGAARSANHADRSRPASHVTTRNGAVAVGALDGQRLPPAAQGGEVRQGPIQGGQAEKGGHHPGGLAQGTLEQGLDPLPGHNGVMPRPLPGRVMQSMIPGGGDGQTDLDGNIGEDRCPSGAFLAWGEPSHPLVDPDQRPSPLSERRVVAGPTRPAMSGGRRRAHEPRPTTCTRDAKPPRAEFRDTAEGAIPPPDRSVQAVIREAAGRFPHSSARTSRRPARRPTAIERMRRSISSSAAHQRRPQQKLTVSPPCPTVPSSSSTMPPSRPEPTRSRATRITSRACP